MSDDDPLFSAHWHRVRHVRPRLAADVVVNRHVYRGRLAWVLHRRSTGVCHRLDRASFELVDRLDGTRSVQEIWEHCLLERDRGAPTQDQWVALLATLHEAELLLVDQRVSAAHLFERREKRRLRERRERHLNPLYLRFALYDPDALLQRIAPLAHRLFSRAAGTVWLVLVGAGLLTLIAHGDDVTARLQDPAFPSTGTALAMLLAYPLIKLLHELAHALAVKRGGGEVHEVGIALMVLLPLPYVDASASAAFASRRDRLLVDVAGILVELALAACGALLWAGTGGALQELGLVLLLIGGVSTLLVNGNPLLRFDAYYALADLLEIPNLSARSRSAILSRLRAWLGGRPMQWSGAEDARERAWLLGYGVVAALYRTGLILWIAWWISDRYLVLGLALAVVAIVQSVLLPAWRGLSTVAADPELHSSGSLARLGGAFAGVFALVFWLPLPHASATQGVVWLPDEALMLAPSACEVTDARVRPGQSVREGDLLFRCSDPELPLRERELLALADELNARLAGLAVDDPSEHARLTAENDANRTALQDVRTRIAAGRQHAALDGRFGLPGTGELTGRALARGETVGYVVPPRDRTVRVALAEHAIGPIDDSLQRVEMRLGDATGGSRVRTTTVVARTPRPSRVLASVALGTAGGGQHPSDPSGDGRQAMQPLFDLELAWPEGASPAPVGSYVPVRFVHAPRPLGPRLADALRRSLDERNAS